MNRFMSSMILVMMFAFIVVFCAFREIGVGIGGTDANAYMLQFKNSVGSLRDQLIRFSGWEPLHTISLWAVRKVTEDYRVYLCIYYFLLSMCLVKYATKYELNSKSFITTFALVMFMLNSFNTQRNTFAVFMVFYIIDAIEKNKYKTAIILSVVATGIHFSAAIFLLSIGGFYFFRYFKGNYRRKVAIYVLFSLGIAVFVGRMIPRIVGNSRLSLYQSSSNVSLSMLMAFGFVVFFQYIYKADVDGDEETKTLTTLYMTFAPMFVFQLYYSILYRFMLFSIPVLYVLIWMYKKMLLQKKTALSYLLYGSFNLILILRIIPFFTSDFSDIGSYTNILF